MLSESSLGLENLLQGDLVTWLVSWHVDYNAIFFFLQKEKRYRYYMMIDNKQHDP